MNTQPKILKHFIEEAKAAGIDEKEALLGKNMPGVDLSGEDLSGFNLTKVNLNGANMSSCNLSGCSLKDAQLRGSTLTNAKLCGADLSYADLSEAVLQYCDLRGATIHETKVAEANFCNAHGLGKQITANLRDRGALVDQNKRSDQNKRQGIEKVIVPITIALITLLGTVLAALFPIWFDKSPSPDPIHNSRVPSERLEQEQEQK